MENNHVSMNVVYLANGITYYKNNLLSSLGLTSVQAESLRFILSAEGNVTVNDLKLFLKVSQPTVSGIVKRLEEKNFLLKKNDRDDARKINLIPTKKSLKLKNRLIRQADETEEILFRNMSQEEIDEFSRLTSKVLDNLSFDYNNKENKVRDPKFNN